MTLRNRLVMSPMETMYGTPDGLPSERTRDYFAARAKGGVGLITVGATGIDHHHPETPGGLHLGSDAAIDAHRALVDVVHEHGAKIQPQIVHAGPDGLGPEMHGVTSIGPSVIPSYLTGRPSAEVTHEQLIEVFDLFKAAVRRAAEAGYDGIELHAEDIDWSYGAGPPVIGTAQNLALILCGRTLAAGQLRGEPGPRGGRDSGPPDQERPPVGVDAGVPPGGGIGH